MLVSGARCVRSRSRSWSPSKSAQALWACVVAVSPAAVSSVKTKPPVPFGPSFRMRAVLYVKVLSSQADGIRRSRSPSLS